MLDKSAFRPTERFSGLAEIYAAARPGYPDAAISFLVTHCGLDHHSLVADVGCGTGISTRLMAERGIPVIGIEPNADMRRKAVSENTVNAAYREGTAEDTGLADGAVHLVMAAQAFHWFEPSRALAEFSRILKPSGWCSLLWNERDETDPFTADFGAVIKAQPGSESVELMRGRPAGQPLMCSDLYEQSRLSVFANEQLLDGNGVIARACSASYAPKDAARLDRLKKELSDVFARHEKGGLVSLKYETLVFTARRK